jgi:hypothetical protein
LRVLSEYKSGRHAAGGVVAAHTRHAEPVVNRYIVNLDELERLIEQCCAILID